MAADNTICRRELDIGIIRKIHFVIDKERDKTVYKETKKDDYRKNGRLT
jgi:hypothetical protein